MIKTPLESCLESELLKLGADLGEREYIEDIRLAAQIDDIEHPEPLCQTDKLIWLAKEASGYQCLNFFGLNLIFKRNSIIGNLNLEYHLWGIENVKNASPAIDQIIKERQYDEEGIFVRRISEQPEENSSLLSLGVKTGKPVQINNYFIRTPAERIIKLYPHFPLYKKSIIDIYKKFNNKMLKPQEIVNLIIDFIKKHKDL